MFGPLRKLFGNTDSPFDHIHPDADLQTRSGERLDETIDAIRQTQMIDPSSLSAEDTQLTEPPQTPNKPLKRGATKNRTPTKQGQNSQTPLYKPSLRPPMAFLAALDDGSLKDAEIYRLCGGSVTIGREQGDHQFPFESLMSGKHASIEYRKESGSHYWHFTDLGSRNGSFFRVQQAYLRNGQEFLLGNHRFAFHMPLPDGSFQDNSGLQSNDADDDARATQLVAPEGVKMPKITYRGLKTSEEVYQLPSTHIVIGTDSSTSALFVPGDPYICRNHARVHHTPRGWLLEDLDSRNGTWLRLHEAKLNQVTEFQLGEQRFYFRPPKARPASS